MSFKSSSFVALAAAALVASSLTSAPALAIVPDSKANVDTDDKGLAMQGYDPVAYFTDGEPKREIPSSSSNIKARLIISRAPSTCRNSRTVRITIFRCSAASARWAPPWATSSKATRMSGKSLTRSFT